MQKSNINNTSGGTSNATNNSSSINKRTCASHPLSYCTLRFSCAALERNFRSTRSELIWSSHLVSLACIGTLSFLLTLADIIPPTLDAFTFLRATSADVFEQLGLRSILITITLISLAIFGLLFYWKARVLTLSHVVVTIQLSILSACINAAFATIVSHEDSEHTSPPNQPAPTTFSISSIVLFILTHETLYACSVICVESFDFILDASLIVLCRIGSAITFPYLSGVANWSTNLYYYLFPLFIIAYRYSKELGERKRFIRTNQSNEWTNMIDSLFSSQLIVSRWDSRHQTIQLVRASANVESKYKVYDSESLKEFLSRIRIDRNRSDFIAMSQFIAPQTSSLSQSPSQSISLKDYLLWRCHITDKYKSNNFSSSNPNNNESYLAKYQRNKAKCKKNNLKPSSFTRGNVFQTKESIESPIPRRDRGKSQASLFTQLQQQNQASQLHSLAPPPLLSQLASPLPQPSPPAPRELIETENLIGYYYSKESIESSDSKYSRVFRIRVAPFSLNQLVISTSLEDITYEDDLKFLAASKMRSDNLLLSTMNDFRLKLLPLLTLQQQAIEAGNNPPATYTINTINNNNEQEENTPIKTPFVPAAAPTGSTPNFATVYFQTVKFNTYVLMNRIYTLFDFFAISERKSITIRMAQFSLKQMLNDVTKLFQSEAQLKGIDFHYENDVVRMDKAVSDERRIKQILITILASSINSIAENMQQRSRISLVVTLDNSSKKKTTDHPSLKFDVYLTLPTASTLSNNDNISYILEQQQQQPHQHQQQSQSGEVTEAMIAASLFDKMDFNVIEEIIKILGPHAIRLEQSISSSSSPPQPPLESATPPMFAETPFDHSEHREQNYPPPSELTPVSLYFNEPTSFKTIKVSFAIYADFVNLRKETRLNTIARPSGSVESSMEISKHRISVASSQNFPSKEGSSLFKLQRVQSEDRTYHIPQSNILSIPQQFQNDLQVSVSSQQLCTPHKYKYSNDYQNHQSPIQQSSSSQSVISLKYSYNSLCAAISAPANRKKSHSTTLATHQFDASSTVKTLSYIDNSVLMESNIENIENEIEDTIQSSLGNPFEKQKQQNSAWSLRHRNKLQEYFQNTLSIPLAHANEDNSTPGSITPPLKQDIGQPHQDISFTTPIPIVQLK